MEAQAVGKIVITGNSVIREYAGVLRCLGGKNLRRGSLFVMVVALALSAVVLAPSIEAFNGGVGSDDREYLCGGSCHTTESSSVITMTASNSTPAPGDPVTVTVDVTGGEASDSPLGVMIVCAMTTTNSLPSADGWTILADPSGTTTYNYYEVESYTGSLSLSWQLSAPTALGVHVLFAREMHGNGDDYYNDYDIGLVVTVTDYTTGGDDDVPTDGVPSVVIISPSNSATIMGNMTVNANIVGATDDPIVSATLKIDNTVIGVLDQAPFTWVVDTTNMSEGGHVVSVTAIDSTGDSVTEEVGVFFDNESEVVSMLEWIVTMGAGTVAIIAITGIMVTLALYIRKRVVERRSR